MSFAVIKTGGKQYKVKSGEILKIEKLTDYKANSKIEFNEILAYGDDSKIEVGAPMVCLLYTSPSPRDLSTSRMPSSA